MKTELAKVAWTEALRVNVPDIDSDHQRLIQLYNALVDDMDRAYHAETIMHALHFLVHYALSHFAREKAFMERIAYPKIEEHCALHSALEKKVRQIFDQFALDKSPEFAQTIIVFLGDWLMNHIMKEDVAVGRYAFSVYGHEMGNND
ncbi:MAG: hemerythrin family protein [Alphaproteobacteria bacterium]|jgi:hemerythrin-like metal-binding protein|nr:hemerythrin family protein [Alphaproteobacteria bacterium]